MDRLATLINIIARHCPEDGIHPSSIFGVKLIRSSTLTMPMPALYEPTLCLIAQGRKHAAIGASAFTYDPSNYLIASVDLPVMGSVIEASPERPYLCLQLNLDISALAELTIRYPASRPEDGLPSIGLELSRTTPALLDAAIRLVGLLDTPEDIDALAPLTTREILYRLLTGESGSIIRQMAQADSRLNQIARAILWIRKYFRENCPIEQAAEIAGMSRSTFHAHFKAVTAMSPLEFRTHLRLQEAQQLMVSDKLDAASAGFRVGYGSPSQFSRDYVRIFGLPPARHAIQLRNAA
ncbi:AraC family transcriptional regulator N-terminal domain-containing protein [Agrobacterium rosae]|uniref:AraC family transcriptional regulator n=1 Tax=Agrobacterium rosae TaxID=1972867 RepID=UPI003BA00EDA